MKLLMNVALAASLVIGCATTASANDIVNLLRGGLSNYVAPSYNNSYYNGYLNNGYYGNSSLGYPSYYNNSSPYYPNIVPGSAYNPYYGNNAYNGYYDPYTGVYGNGSLKSRLLNGAANVLLNQLF